MLSANDLKIQDELKKLNEKEILEILATKHQSINANVAKIVTLIQKAQIENKKSLAITSKDLECETFSVATVYNALQITKLAKKNGGHFNYPAKFYYSGESRKNSNLI